MPPKTNTGWETIHSNPQPGDPDYISVEEVTRREVARRAAYEALPSTIERRKIEARRLADIEAARAAKRKKPEPVKPEDYPWMRPGWRW